MDELEDFKTHINLTEYAASQGYVLDRKASSLNSVVMRHQGGDKIVIARGQDRHWIYFSVRDDTDNGTIIDFVQQRKGVKLGGVRQELRPWIGGARTVARPHPDLFARELEPITKNRARVLLDKARELWAEHSPDLLDGVKVRLPEGWFIIRPSNTEPVVRVIAEAGTEDAARGIAEQAWTLAAETLDEHGSHGGQL